MRRIAFVVLVAVVVALAGGDAGRGLAGRASADAGLSAISGAVGITVGQDAALWFTDRGGDSIGRITTGGAISSYALPEDSWPSGIVAGPDGALWFTLADSIGRITTGAVITTYTGSYPTQAVVTSPTASPAT